MFLCSLELTIILTFTPFINNFLIALTGWSALKLGENIFILFRAFSIEDRIPLLLFLLRVLVRFNLFLLDANNAIFANALFLGRQGIERCFLSSIELRFNGRICSTLLTKLPFSQSGLKMLFLT